MLCFYIVLVEIENKMSLNCLFLKYNCVISFLALKTIEAHKSIYYTCFCVHYFKSYGEIYDILEIWRPFWI